MKKIFTLVLVIACKLIYGQENGSSVYQQQLEHQAAQEESETEDDAYWQYLELRRKHRLNLNKAGLEELRELNLLTDLQIENMLKYRGLFGRLLSIYELQAIPGWDLGTIRNLLPFITVNNETEIPGSWRHRFSKGESKLLLRFAQVLEKAKGFQQSDSGSHYLGSPAKILFRYRYQFRDQLQYGLTGDKDAGEQLVKGFDFYSFHFFVRRLGIIKAFALGDFIINLGQGLTHWQGQAFKKTAAVLNIKRQSAVLKPYTAAGEYNFHRGAAITLRRKNWQSTFFASIRKWSAAIHEDNYISSVQLSGYHRSNSELQNRHAVNVFATGANVQFRGHRGQIGINGIYHSFSIPFRSSGDAYDVYALNGKNWFNASIDYSYTFSNFHTYGEIAVDKNFSTAIINGLLCSAGTAVDLSLVFRRISPAYQTVAGNAFTENTQPTNENGIYAGISFRPAYGWQIDAYADAFRFPWLKFGVEAPSQGSDYLLQITFKPNKQTEIYSRLRIEEKSRAKKKNWRSHIFFQPTKEISLGNRVEILWYESAISKTGFLFFQDIQLTPANRPWKLAVRLQYFESDDYDTRLYAFENSVMYNFSLPAFFNKGTRYYATFQYKAKFLRALKHPVSCILGFNISRTIYAAGTEIGSGQDLLPGSSKTEGRLQAIFAW